jgi:hypothetical protein
MESARKKEISLEDRSFLLGEIRGVTTKIIDGHINEGKRVANDIIDSSILPIFCPILFEVPFIRIFVILYS